MSGQPNLAALIRDTTKEEPPDDRRVLVWVDHEQEWQFAFYNQTQTSMKGGRLPNKDGWATWMVGNTEGSRNYRWFIDLALLKPPESK